MFLPRPRPHRTGGRRRRHTRRPKQLRACRVTAGLSPVLRGLVDRLVGATSSPACWTDYEHAKRAVERVAESSDEREQALRAYVQEVQL